MVQPGQVFIPRHRKLSRFLVEQLLLEYLDERLDHDTRRAVEEVIKKDKQLSSLVLNYKKADHYCTGLKTIQIQEEYIQQLSSKKSKFEIWRQRLAWSQWPTFVRWGVEALLISTAISTVALIVPWEKFLKLTPQKNHEVLLTQVHKEPDKEPTPPPPVEEKPAPIVAAPAVEKPAVVEAKQVESVADVEEKKPAAGQPKGFVYRADMALGNIEELNATIVTEIEKLGGVKAGQVELGWKKPKGRYFHFTLPESNYESLVQYLRTFGPVQITKAPHWRVMHEGEIRIILWIEGS